IGILIPIDLPSPGRLTRTEERVVRAAEEAPVGSSPAESLAVAGIRRQTDVARQVVPSAQAQVLAHGSHTGMVAGLGKVVFPVVAAREARHDGVRIVAVVAMRHGSD